MDKQKGKFEELGESELGRQDYWNTRYAEELECFSRNREHVGEIWFGEDIENRLIRWLQSNEKAKNASIVDIGCGNGMLLIQLSKAGYTNLHGVDYCVNAIELAKKVANDYNEPSIKYEVVDILKDNLKFDHYDKVLDKGTYDAISLMPQPAVNRTKYIDNVKKCLKFDGLLVMTSCNWTKEELLEQFAQHFSWHSDIPTPEFKFGGKVGNVVTCVTFQKKC